MAQKLNQAWQSYNDLNNEGGEGYNPHPKWITARRDLATTTAAQTKRTTENLVRDLRGNLISESALRSQLANNRTRIATITDPTARVIVQRSIDHAIAQLGENVPTPEPTSTAQLYHCTVTRQPTHSDDGRAHTLRTVCLADLDSTIWEVQHPDDPSRWLDLPSSCVVLGALVEPPDALIAEAGEIERTWEYDKGRGWSYR
jgi:hypothetical protein